MAGDRGGIEIAGSKGGNACALGLGRGSGRDIQPEARRPPAGHTRPPDVRTSTGVSLS